MYNTFMLKNKFLSFTLFLTITFSASIIGRLTTFSSKEPWYSQLEKSKFNPPDWIFAPVWTTLYFMMTLAVWIFWHSKNRDTNTIYIYFIHILLNTTWSIVFFAMHNIFLALINLMILVLLIIVLTLRFKRVNNVSAYLMIPYLLWSCYALTLNFNLYLLN